MMIVAAYLSVTQNQSFWNQVIQALPDHRFGRAEVGLVVSLFAALYVILLVIMLPLSARKIIKPALIALLLVASVCSYFMDSFGVIIDQAMVLNMVQTDPREAGELMNFKMLSHVAVLGVIPSLLVWRIRLKSSGVFKEVLSRAILLMSTIAILLVCALSNYKDVSLWARAHRDVRLYLNPSYPIYSTFKFFKSELHTPGPTVLLPIARDAQRQPAASGKPRVLIMVVGETARAENFQLSGYQRATNPELSVIDGVFNFSQMWSCGTATAVSVPCMFSRLDRTDFSRSKARQQENLLDVLNFTGVSVLWRDNNSDCKGVCERVETEDFRASNLDGMCNEDGCYDEVLLDGLEARVGSATQDQFIALHLLGSHGPSYYRRYPEAFRRFTPDCARDDVQTCSQQEIVNAYDNTMLYTDHVLAQVIRLLERQKDSVEPTLIYMSDHGESLGENGIYLHGLPYSVAPDEQKRVPFLIWSPALNGQCMKDKSDNQYSQDNLFDTVIGLFSIRTTIYQEQADITQNCAHG